MTFNTATLLQNESAAIDVLSDTGEVVATLYARRSGFELVTTQGWTAEFGGRFRDDMSSPLRLEVTITPDPRSRRTPAQPAH